VGTRGARQPSALRHGKADGRLGSTTGREATFRIHAEAGRRGLPRKRGRAHSGIQMGRGGRASTIVRSMRPSRTERKANSVRLPTLSLRKM
jgi:hypothetical protein